VALPFVTGLGPASHIIFHAVEVGRDLEKAAETERAAQHAEDAVRHASDEASHLESCVNSFTPDTLVATDQGEKPIGQIRVGDQVLAYDEASGTTGYYPVTAVIVNLDPALLALTIDGQVVEATPGHPFYVAGHGWVNAGDLWVGAPIRHADGTTGTVQGIRLETRPQVMYNLTVADAHTFFVGAQQVLVHNSCRIPNDPNKHKHIFQNRTHDHKWNLTGLSRADNIKLVEQIANDASNLVGSIPTANGGTTYLFRKVVNGLTIEIEVYEDVNGARRVSDGWVK